MAFQSHLTTLPTAVWPLASGLLITSPLLWGNVGLSLVGPLPIIKEEIAPSGLSKKDKVRIWALFFNKAGPLIVTGTALTTTLHVLAAIITPSSYVRKLSIVSAIASMSIIPYTLVAIMPTNQRLNDLDNKDNLVANEEAEVTSLLRVWDERHKVRFVGYAVGWATGLAALWATVAG